MHYDRVKLVKHSQLPELNEKGNDHVQTFGTPGEALDLFKDLPKLGEPGDAATKVTAFRRRVPETRVTDEVTGVARNRNPIESTRNQLPETNTTNPSVVTEELGPVGILTPRVEDINTRYPKRNKEKVVRFMLMEASKCDWMLERSIKFAPPTPTHWFIALLHKMGFVFRFFEGLVIDALEY